MNLSELLLYILNLEWVLKGESWFDKVLRHVFIIPVE